jgi:Bacterial Ig-like domain (group 3)/Pro-kumamolisin, activation domain
MKTLKTQFALLLLSALCLLTGAYGQVTLPHHVPQKVENGSALPIGNYNPEQMLRLVLAVQPPHMAEEEQFIQELVTKGSPNFHQFLTPEEWNARFAPAAEDEQKVVDWAQSQGLTVTKRYANRLIVDVEAPAGIIEKAFGITINNYQVEDEVDFSNDRDPAIPDSLSGILHDVLGLNSIQRVHRLGAGKSKQKGPDYVAGPIVTNQGSAQGSGDPTKSPMLRAARGNTPESNLTPMTAPPLNNGVANPDNITNSEAYDYDGLARLSHCCNVHNDPGGSPPSSSIALVTGGNFEFSDVGTFFSYYGMAYNITAYSIAGSWPGQDDEAPLDVEYSTAMSNSYGSPLDTAHVYVYEEGNNYLSTIATVYNTIVSDDHAKVVSTSYGWTEGGSDDSWETLTMHPIFNTMVGEGWTLIAAAGDGGTTDSCSDAINVDWPASDPDFLAAGGTELLLNSSGNYVSETAWVGETWTNNGGACAANKGGGGGGMSTLFSAPFWQSPLGYTPRAMPDISLTANPDVMGEWYYYDGQWRSEGGTSIVAPELAGFFAQENTYLNYVGPICGASGNSTCTPIGLASPLFYDNAIYGAPHNPFYDITKGCTSNNITNQYHLTPQCAGPGFDLATGWGSANMMQLAWDLNWEVIPAAGTPSVAFSGPTTSKWYSTNQTVEWTVSDAGSGGYPAPGVAGFTQGWDSIPADPYSEPHGGTGNSFYSGPEFAFATAGCLAFVPNGCSGGVSQGCHTVQVEGWDNEGRTTFGSYGPLCYDTVAPVATASVTGTLVGSKYENLALVTLSATDSGYPSTGSGVANIYYLANELGVFEPYSSSFLLGKNGVNTVKYYAVDVAGNISSTKTLTFGIINTTSISLASSANPSGAGKAVKFTATVSAGLNTATGSVTFYDGGTVLATTALAGGVASFTTSKLASGTHLITASFLGSTYFVASESSGLVQYIEPGTTTVITSSANPSVYGQSVTLTASISHGTTIPTGTVTFEAGTTVLATVTVGSSGTATYTSSTFTVGTHPITAVYSGDSNYVGSTSAAFSQLVEKAATKTSLASSVNPSTFGQSVTLTATVTAVAPGSGTPTGSVKFYDGTTLLGSHGLTSGVAALVTTKLVTGTDSITAVYVASTDYDTSTSGALSQVVDKANTKVTLAASPNPSTSGATVTFTATVATVAPGAGTPTGTVTFMDGATELGTGTLNSSKKATFATASLAAGTHSITAVYSGDSNFNGDTSAVLSQQVNP